MTVAVQARRKLPEARATGIGRRLGTSRRLWEAQIADPFDLQRFVDAQAPVYERVRQELKVGRKQSHWMWFIFPQIAGLGQSPMSVRFAIASLDEAKAYLAHPILGARLRECAQLTLDVEGKRARRLRFDRRDEIPLFHDPVRAGHAGRRRLSALHRQVFCRRLGSGHACEDLGRIFGRSKAYDIMLRKSGVCVIDFPIAVELGASCGGVVEDRCGARDRG
jgi:uncharacterized protein (DUF1810 family)